MSSKLPEGFEFNAQGLVVTSLERLDEYVSEAERLARIDEASKALTYFKGLAEAGSESCQRVLVPSYKDYIAHLSQPPSSDGEGL